MASGSTPVDGRNGGLGAARVRARRYPSSEADVNRVVQSGGSNCPAFDRAALPAVRFGRIAMPRLLFRDGSRWLLFEEPTEVLECSEPGQLRPLLASLDRAAERGAFAAGYLAYEAAA